MATLPGTTVLEEEVSQAVNIPQAPQAPEAPVPAPGQELEVEVAAQTSQALGVAATANQAVAAAVQPRETNGNSPVPQAAATAPGAPPLFDIAMKRFDAFWNSYQEMHRRAGTLFGFSSFLVAGAALCIERGASAGISRWLVAGTAAVLFLVYAVMAWSCYQAMKMGSFPILVEPHALLEQAAFDPVDVAKAKLLRSIEAHNELLRVATNFRAGHVQRAVVLCSTLAALTFLASMVVPIAKGQSTVSTDTKNAAPPGPSMSASPQPTVAAAPPTQQVPQPNPGPRLMMFAPYDMGDDGGKRILMSAHPEVRAPTTVRPSGAQAAAPPPAKSPSPPPPAASPPPAAPVKKK